MVEVAVDEKVLKPPCRRRVIHDYGEPIEAEVQVYALEEIIAMLAYVERTWSQWLGNLVPDLPSFQTVMGQLRPQIVTILNKASRP